ncbi:hypothetical protein THRCLA_01006 [Thraustotheca clavata]|uniref:Uncharacterized protein n=1 Tax=Thraustotheca clavata TaxID=74557 RepID=A0A1W0A9K4_9STRA|nr:hypothetical protein THRCLA_01006 [Thraustotheca clavata]
MTSTKDPVPLVLAVTTSGLLVLFIIWRMIHRSRRRQHHSPLDVGNRTFAENIHRRKQDLHRYIDTLQRKLNARKTQLQMHEEVEQILTTRAAMESNVCPDGSIPLDDEDDEMWSAIMKRGKEMYRDAWEASKNGELSLKEQMQLHKTELLASSTPREAPDKKLHKTIERQNKATLHAHEQMTARMNDPRHQRAAVLPIVHSQWKSERKRGGYSMESIAPSMPIVTPAVSGESWSRGNFGEKTVPKTTVPTLNLAALKHMDS